MKLSEAEKLMANRLGTQVTFLPASYDKRFCRSLPLEGEYSEKQIAYLHKCFHKYRRQIKDYESIKSQLTWPYTLSPISAATPNAATK